MPYKIEVLKYVSEVDEAVKSIGAANTVLNQGGSLCAYNTDASAAFLFLSKYDNQKKLYIIGNGGYAKAVRWAALTHKFNIEQITRDSWADIRHIKSSIVYNCTPVDISPLVDQSNIFIDCSVKSKTGKKLANLQASRQFELYTNLEWPL